VRFQHFEDMLGLVKTDASVTLNNLEVEILDEGAFLHGDIVGLLDAGFYIQVEFLMADEEHKSICF